MNYKEAWEELTQKLEKAELELYKLKDKKNISTDEKERLTAKISGLMIAEEYIHEMNCSINENKTN